jgi:transposase
MIIAKSLYTCFSCGHSFYADRDFHFEAENGDFKIVDEEPTAQPCPVCGKTVKPSLPKKIFAE